MENFGHLHGETLVKRPSHLPSPTLLPSSAHTLARLAVLICRHLANCTLVFGVGRADLNRKQVKFPLEPTLFSGIQGTCYIYPVGGS